MFQALTLLTAPFAQIGLSYYLSGASLMAVMALWANRSYLSAPLSRHGPPLAIIAALFLLPVIMFPGFSAPDLLRAVREALFFFLMAVLFRGRFELRRGEIRSVELATTFMMVALLGVVAIQLVSLAGGRYWGFPRELFVMNENTIVTALDIYWTRVRPTGPYGEPSYLGFFAVSIIFAFLPSLTKSKWAAAVIFLAAIMVLSIRSSAAIVGLGVVLAVYFSSDRELARLRVWVLVAGVVALLLSGEGGEILNRLSNLGDRRAEASGYARLVGPALALPRFLYDHPLGVPVSQMPFILPSYVEVSVWTEFLHNAIWAMFYTNGLLAPIFLFFLFAAGRDAPTKAFILVCAMFNGALFSVDKFAIMFTSIALYSAFRSAKAHQRQAAEPSAAPARPVQDRRRPATPPPARA
jgi:hypothetical protein